LTDWYTQETFFRRPEVRRQACTLPAPIYNHCRRLLAAAERGCVFVPIRDMQFIAVIDAQEVIFVDSQGGHLVVDGQGGRPILLSWVFGSAATRESLSAPVAFEVVHYQIGLEPLQRQLIGGFARALDALNEKRRESSPPARGARILPLR
jgi:hypothetical protein